MKRVLIYILVIFVCAWQWSCVEEINLQTETEFDSALVIEATITNEMKNQVIKLSRTYRLEESGPVTESEATVRVVGNGVTYTFQEDDPGIYLSTQAFAAQPNVDYQLSVSTSDGREYTSNVMQLTPETPIGELYVERGFNENENEGVSVFVDTQDDSGASKYYRFEYEETYKVIAPLYSPQELIILNDDFIYPQSFLDDFFDQNGLNVEEMTNFFLDLQFRPEQEQICYNTVVSNNILITSTEELETDQLDQFRIRFLNRSNTIISHRYSILVRQFIQSEEAHVFYRTLRDFSNQGSLLSEIQTGFIEGNVSSVTNQNELVVGFFEVSAVDERRIYFNYADLFPGDILPPYFVTCADFISPVLLEEDFAHNITNSPIIDALRSGWVYYESNDVPTYGSPFGHAPFVLVLEECGDCTLYGNNEIPDFWEE